MKRVLLSALGLVLGGSSAALAKDTSSLSAAGVQHGFPADAREQLAKNAVTVVDVREADELTSGMAKGAVHMPLSLVQKNGPEFQKFVSTLAKDTEVWVYCRSGRRSGIVAEKLNALGFKVRNIGGFADWQAAGLPSK